MRRKLFLFFVLSFIALPIFARVLSYAPYTNRVARSGYHLRETRYFPIIEGDWTDDFVQRVVLHDSSGKEEPRVLYPLDATTEPNTIEFVAWHEGSSLATSKALVLGYDAAEQKNVVRYSRDGGATWTRLSALDSHYFYDRYIDRGGPYVRGMSGAVRVGNAATPFVILLGSGQLFAIEEDGNVRLLAGAQAIVGQNRAGTKFLVRTYAAVETVDLAGNRKHVRGDTGNQMATGWISDDGSIYLLDQGRLDRFTATGSQMVARYEYNMNDSWRFLAVPTYDFSGAWIAQVHPVGPTSLWRYTPELGLMMMWSDVSAPEIEALIAGASGNSVLIQVHRDRSLALQRPFIDPALAVWRVGQDAPREYDELYLNEEENKGFIHVDVEKLADGTPFVFDSGAFQGGLEEGPVSPPVGGGGDVIQEWGIVRGSLRQRLILPGVARLRGAFDSEWMTDVTIYNPAAVSQRVEIRYVPMGEVASESIFAQRYALMVTLQPHEVSFIPDALHALFDIESGGGSLHFLPASGINVFGRTYSRKGAGTFGFGMQAIDAFNAAGAGFPLTFAGAFPGKNFRTNILLTDTSGRGTEASLGAYGVSGPYGTSTAPAVYAPAGGTLQFNAVGPALSVEDNDAGGLKIQPTRGTAIATVVSIDNRTNDPTYFPPDLTATIARVIPVIGHLAGANNSQFRSDLYLFNPSRQTRTVQLEAKQWDGGAFVIKRFTLLPNEARVVPDALLTLFGMTGLARVQYATLEQGDGVRVTSRTYTIEESGATYGSLVPPLNNFQIGTAGDDMEILGAVHNDGFRTNIGLVELSPSQSVAPNVNVRIRIIDASRTKEETFTVAVPRAGGLQINDIFRARNFDVEGGALIVVEVLTEGLIGAYATLTDNTTNDTTYLASQLGAKPN